MSVFVKYNFVCVLIQARKGSGEKQDHTALQKKSSTDSAAGSTNSPSKTNRRGSMLEDVISPSPKKNPAPVKASSKLAMLKKKDDEKDEGAKSKTPISPTKIKISPKKEPLASVSSDKKFTPKTGTTPTALKTSPKKPEVKPCVWTNHHICQLKCIKSKS